MLINISLRILLLILNGPLDLKSRVLFDTEQFGTLDVARLTKNYGHKGENSLCINFNFTLVIQFSEKQFFARFRKFDRPRRVILTNREKLWWHRVFQDSIFAAIFYRSFFHRL